uniref:C-type lectin domain-containing protein n=1 Tax=Panagrolaimus sp. PS1159 TaxID=55785 RepID=A0AC35GG41_9BILA
MILVTIIFVSLFATAFGSCPNNNSSITWNSKCYVYYKDAIQFNTAAYNCKNLGGDLPSIHDAFVNSLLNDYVTNHVHNVFRLNFWTGGSNLFVPNTWTWMDGTAFDYTVWDIDEPRNASWANCIGFVVPAGKWDAFDCTNKRPYFCEFPITNSTGSQF